MPSAARANLTSRLADINQLLEAHKAITKFKRAEAAAQQAGGALADVSRVFDALVTDPGPGKPKEVDAINRAAFVLLCSHLQGFIDDLHREAANIVLNGKVQDVGKTIKLIKPRNANPHVEVIETMFSGLGIYDLMQSVRWQKCSNSTVRERLRRYIEDRNKIAHGAQVGVSKDKVERFKKYVETLADKLDESVAQKIQGLVGNRPW
ncbi:HEPN domain-containing protein [Halomonas organivorans]|uniref:RiboL-PSP-HEPN domain-containing protein n=1 Tax=Halomonas organivorans TaxID=257772 RepID=A0A7W5G5P2_9GAMM|nr:HEPN domain-containing protein [Halomonas organivorans]MBB3141107.1 hypothetical protein [Halomonas organivorans]